MAQYKSGIRTKRSIYYACEKLFYEQGYEATKISDINELSQTNKSSFYHHYTNKLELGVQVYFTFARSNARVTSLFGNTIDRITGICLDLKTFWYLFYKDEKIRRFAIDLSNENVLKIKENESIYNACLQLTKKEISEYEMKFIRTAHLGLTKQLNQDAYTITRSYEDISDFYLRTLFHFFAIDEETIDQVLAKTKECFSKCIITNEGFHVTCRLKSE